MLQLVLGRAGSGKTEFIINKIVNDIKNGKENILLLVPEQFSFASGNIFLSQLGEKDFNKLEISDFTRLAYEVKRLFGGENMPILDNGGKAVMMNRAITAVQDSLKLYNKKITSNGFVISMTKMYTELKTCGVNFDDLLTVGQKVKNKTLQNKLADICLIMKGYEALINGAFLDADDELTRLYDKLLTVNYLKGRTVYIDGFNGFTSQELKIIERIFIDAEDVYITFTADKLVDDESQFGVFSNVKENAQKVVKLAQKLNVNVKSPIVLEQCFRFNNAIKYIEQNLFCVKPNVYDDVTDDVVIFNGKNIYDECDFVAREIKKLLRINGYRCKDIVVLARETDTYSVILESAFKRYEVPFYEDERQEISTQPLVNLIDYAFKIINSSFSGDNVMSYAKTNLLSLTNEEVCELENYVFMWKINGKKWLSDFDKHPDGFVAEFSDNDKSKLQRINNTRKIIIEPLVKLKNSVSNANGKAIAKSLYYFLISIGANENLKKLAVKLNEKNLTTLSEEQGRVWDLVMQAINQIAVTVGDANISAVDFADIFNLIISVQDLGNIPQGLDNVAVGSAFRMVGNNPKVAFVMGLNEGEFPKNSVTANVLTTVDRRSLEQFEIKLFSNERESAVQEKFIAYSALTMPKEKLYLSSYSSTINGEIKNPSIVINSVKQILPNCKTLKSININYIDKIESSRSAFELYASHWKNGDQLTQSLRECLQNDYAHIISAIEFQNKLSVSKLDSHVAEKLYGNDLTVSASKIERYFTCPFMYFCQYGANAKGRKTAEIDPMQLGTIVHFVFEKMFSDYNYNELLTFDESKLSDIIKSILSVYFVEYMGVKSDEDKRMSYLYFRLEKSVLVVVKKMLEDMSMGDFKPIYCEMKIGKNEQVDALEIELQQGKLFVKGTVDRVDVLEKDGVKYLRVVDYKTGSKKFALSDVIHGLNMQMLIYLYTIGEKGQNELSNLVPSSIMYIPSTKKDVSAYRYSTKEQISSELYKKLEGSGLALYDEKVLNGINSSSDTKINRFGRVKGVPCDLMTREDSVILNDKIKELLKRMGDEIHSGNVSTSPVLSPNHQNTCEYCDYSDVCVNQLYKDYNTFDDFDHNKAFESIRKRGEDNAQVDK